MGGQSHVGCRFLRALLGAGFERSEGGATSRAIRIVVEAEPDGNAATVRSRQMIVLGEEEYGALLSDPGGGERHGWARLDEAIRAGDAVVDLHDRLCAAGDRGCCRKHNGQRQQHDNLE